MTLRRKVLIFTTASFTLAVAIGAYHEFNLYRELLRREKDSFCKESDKEFKQLVEFHKRIANSISSYIAKDPEVIDLFKRGEKEKLYQKLKPLYEEVRKENLIREMTLFKLPADLFLNVRVPEAKPWKTKREDIITAGKTCTTTKSIMICINYVGIRAVNPIVDRGKTLGVVSVGIDMRDFLKHYTSITGTGCGLAVKDEALRRSLREESYRRYLSTAVRKGEFVVVTNRLKEDLVDSSGFGRKESEIRTGRGLFLMCSTPIKDFSGKRIGYFFTLRDISSLSASIALESFKNLLRSYVPALFLIFVGSLLLLGRFSHRVHRLYRITELIKLRRFEELNKYSPGSRDEFGAIESALLNMAQEIEKYINVLSKEIEVYTSKAYIDNLTGVFNRRAFDEFGRELIERFLTLGRPISVLMIDIDDFKSINDTHGHQTGDRVLRELGELIRDSLRETDMVFRYGGEEFLVILPGTPLEGALRAGENVRKRVELHSFPIEGGSYKLTVSIGVAQGHREDRSAGDLIGRADRALYLAKKTGKNRVVPET